MASLMPMGTVIPVFFHQPRKVKKRTCLRSSRPMKFIISCKRPPPRSAPSGSKPSRWPPGLGSEDTPAAPPHPPEGTPPNKLGPGSIHFWRHINKKGPRAGTFSPAGVLNVTNHMPGDVHLHPTVWLTAASATLRVPQADIPSYVELAHSLISQAPGSSSEK